MKRNRIAYVAALLTILAIVVGAACAPAAPAPTPTPYPDTFPGLVACVQDGFSGALERPRRGPFADVPYVTDIYPDMDAWTGAAWASVAEGYFLEHLEQPALEYIERCQETRSYDGLSEEDAERQREIEMDAAGGHGTYLMLQVALFAPDMGGNCQRWQALTNNWQRTSHTKAQLDQDLADWESVSQPWDTFDARWVGALSGERATRIIDQACVEHWGG